MFHELFTSSLSLSFISIRLLSAEKGGNYKKMYDMIESAIIQANIKLINNEISLTSSLDHFSLAGVHFDTSSKSLVSEITTAIKVYAYGVEDFVNDPKNKNRSLNTQLSCEGAGEARWSTGDLFFK